MPVSGEKVVVERRVPSACSRTVASSWPPGNVLQARLQPESSTPAGEPTTAASPPVPLARPARRHMWPLGRYLPQLQELAIDSRDLLDRLPVAMVVLDPALHPRRSRPRSFGRASSCMSPDPERAAETRQWMLKARHDLLAASALLQVSPSLPDIAAYHCQQAAEKALRAPWRILRL